MRPDATGDQRADCVRSLQELLRARGAPIDATGNYLTETARHITEFQRARGLRPDGVVDEQTSAALADLPRHGARWDLRRDCVSLSLGSDGAPNSHGQCVVTLRARLAANGASGPAGEEFDTAAEAAVRTFQSAWSARKPRKPCTATMPAEPVTCSRPARPGTA